MQAENLPLVSVIIVNYNYGLYLSEAVHSVLTQSYPNVECIIVDNASTDDSHRILKEVHGQFPALKLILRKDNGGQSVASIEGFEASTGEYVIFLDADDYLLLLVSRLTFSFIYPCGSRLGFLLEICFSSLVRAWF